MSKDLTMCLVPFGSEAYQQTLQVRHKILRAPLGLSLSDEECKNEFLQFHLAVFIENEVIACLVLMPYNDHTMKMRQVAVAQPMQGKGIGSKMVLEAEKICINKKMKALVLNARDTAVPFYLKLGYKIVSDFFIELTINHIKMEKIL